MRTCGCSVSAPPRTSPGPQRPGCRSGQHRARQHRLESSCKACDARPACVRDARTNRPDHRCHPCASADWMSPARAWAIAVIDSGITNWHDDLYRSGSGRVAHFKDFTNDTRVWSSNARVRRLRSRHARRGHHRRHGLRLQRQAQGDCAGSSKLVGLKVMDRLGRGYMSDVIAAIDYAISVKATYNIRVINLSVASGVYESVLARSADAGRATRGRCRDRRRRVGRQPRSELAGREADGRHHLSWQRAVGADRWRIERRRHEPSQQRHHRALQLSVDRPGSTSRPSPISWRPASGSSRCRIRAARSTPRCPRCCSQAASASAFRTSRI